MAQVEQWRLTEIHMVWFVTKRMWMVMANWIPMKIKIIMGFWMRAKTNTSQILI